MRLPLRNSLSYLKNILSVGRVFLFKRSDEAKEKKLGRLTPTINIIQKIIVGPVCGAGQGGGERCCIHNVSTKPDLSTRQAKRGA